MEFEGGQIGTIKGLKEGETTERNVEERGRRKRAALPGSNSKTQNVSERGSVDGICGGLMMWKDRTSTVVVGANDDVHDDPNYQSRYPK